MLKSVTNYSFHRLAALLRDLRPGPARGLLPRVVVRGRGRVRRLQGVERRPGGDRGGRRRGAAGRGRCRGGAKRAER